VEWAGGNPAILFVHAMGEAELIELADELATDPLIRLGLLCLYLLPPEEVSATCEAALIDPETFAEVLADHGREFLAECLDAGVGLPDGWWPDWAGDPGDWVDGIN